MTMDVFRQTMKWIDFFVAQGTQTELNLFGIGEPTLNPHFVEMVKEARRHLPAYLPLQTNTNGNKMTDELAGALKIAGIAHVDVTGHNPYTAAKAIKCLKKYGIFGTLSVDFMLTPNNWAGQVEWFPADYKLWCGWIGRGQVMVMWDGRVTTCCIDSRAKGVVGTVYDEKLNEVMLKKWELCDKCHHLIKEEL
jgi:hypothetical protein